jgi:hypothetical protein
VNRAAGIALLAGNLLLANSGSAMAQVLIRIADPQRAGYSELHEGLLEGTPAADSVLAIFRTTRPEPLWQRVRAALRGTSEWNHGHLALTRLAELRSAAYADSAARLRRRLEAGGVKGPPGRESSDLIAPLDAVLLERARATRGDSAVLADLLARVPTRNYGLAEAWVLGRIDGSSDSLQSRFLASTDTELKVRYLTLLGFSDDSSAVPLLARVYAAPDSFGVPPRFGSRASDALLWIGTRQSLEALLEARRIARARGSYADPALARGGYDFLANDSSAVISRTGRWLTTWIETLPRGSAQQQRVGPSP